MQEASATHTSATLLGRMRSDPADQAAWRLFADRYGPKIHRWCRRWNLSDIDSEDVTQIVLLKLAEKMRGFTYDSTKSFRAWLKTLTRHAWSDFLDSRRRAVAASGDSAAWLQLESLQARDDLVINLQEEFDHEVLEEAMERVRSRVTPDKWEVFRLMAIEGLSGAETARRQSIKIATSFVIRSKVQKMIQEEIHQLEISPSEDES